MLRSFTLRWVLQPGFGRNAAVSGGESGVVSYVWCPVALRLMRWQLVRFSCKRVSRASARSVLSCVALQVCIFHVVFVCLPAV